VLLGQVASSVADERVLGSNTQADLSQGANSSQPSLEFRPGDTIFRALRSVYHVG
jgi:hypothetical protein